MGGGWGRQAPAHLAAALLLVGCGRSDTEPCTASGRVELSHEDFETGELSVMSGGFTRYRGTSAVSGDHAAVLYAPAGTIATTTPVTPSSGELGLMFQLRNEANSGTLVARVGAGADAWHEAEEGLPDLQARRSDWTGVEARFSIGDPPLSLIWQIEVTGLSVIAGTFPLAIEDVVLIDRAGCRPPPPCAAGDEVSFAANFDEFTPITAANGSFGLALDVAGGRSMVLPAGASGTLQPLEPIQVSADWATVSVELLHTGTGGHLRLALSRDGGATFPAEAEPADLSAPRPERTTVQARFRLGGVAEPVTFLVSVDNAPAGLIVWSMALRTGFDCPSP